MTSTAKGPRPEGTKPGSRDTASAIATSVARESPTCRLHDLAENLSSFIFTATAASAPHESYVRIDEIRPSTGKKTARLLGKQSGSSSGYT